MLEVLYATGLRVSELVGLTVQQINLRQGVIRVTGKGNKERLIPFGSALNQSITDYLRLRERIFPNARFEGKANVLVFSNVDAASGVRNIMKMVAGALEVGPILMGMGNKAHIVTPSITARGLLNIAALAGTPVAHYG